MRKVRTGWYTIPVRNFEQAWETKEDELHVDVSKQQDVWVVSTRDNYELKYATHRLTCFYSCRGAKLFAQDWAAWYKSQADLPLPDRMNKKYEGE